MEEDQILIHRSASVNFDDIPEDKEESYPCPKCEVGNVILNENGSWECDACDWGTTVKE